jgi:hypothetical protein
MEDEMSMEMRIMPEGQDDLPDRGDFANGSLSHI